MCVCAQAGTVVAALRKEIAALQVRQRYKSAAGITYTHR